MNCTRCDGTGFLNTHQLPGAFLESNKFHSAVIDWIAEQAAAGVAHDVSACDCCGDGQQWYGEPGEHYSAADPRGPHGPYAKSGGVCDCH